jgi:tetratricopeptide (TPR) repeat protein
MGLHEKKRLKQQKQQTLQRTLKYAGIFALASAGVVGLLFLVVTLAASTKEDFLAEGDDFVAEGLWAEGIIQYRKAIELDSNYGQARYQLAKAYLHQRQLRGAMGEYIRAADLLPNNIDAQIQATKFLLLARRFDDAKARAEKALQIDPKNVEAQIGKATAVAKMVDLDGGVYEIKQAIRMDPTDARSFMMLGAMQGGQKNLPEAEAAFKRAVELAPKSLHAQQALAAFYLKTGRLDEAEKWLRRSVETDPNQLGTQRRLAGFLVAVGRGAEAEAPLKALAEATQTTAAHLTLADYYLGQGRPADAREVLQPLWRNDTDGYVPAKVRLARLEYLEGRPKEAHALLQEALAKDSRDVDALVLRAQLLMREGDVLGAMQVATTALTAGPSSTEARLIVAEAHARRNELPDAIRNLNEALQLDPQLEPARLRLVQLQLLKGDVELAVRLSEEAVRSAPDSVAALLIRARARIAADKLPDAEADLKLLLQGAPNLALVHAQYGELHMRRKNLAAARSAFDRAKTLDPGSFEVLRGFITLDVLEKRPERATATLEQQLRASPNSAQLQMLAASVYAMTGDLAKREAALQRAIAIDPNDLGAVVALANQYVDQNRLEEAKRQLEGLSRGPTAAGAQTMLGLILQTQNKKPEAIKVYEQVLGSTPDAMVAANNLAWLYSETDANLDRALDLAQSATRQRPDSAEFNHTLGTIYMKKGLAPSAVRAFQVSVKSAPNEPEYRYSLALAYAKNADRTKALEELRVVLKQKPDFRLAQLALEEMTSKR